MSDRTSVGHYEASSLTQMNATSRRVLSEPLLHIDADGRCTTSYRHQSAASA